MLYWYGYSMGKVKNIFWGVYHIRKHQFELIGSCHYNNLTDLNDTLYFKKSGGFELVASLTENKIDATINKFLEPHLQIETTLNRIDFDRHFVRNGLIRVIGDEFLDYVEHNLVLLENVERLCRSKESCFNQTEFELLGQEGCDQYCYGNNDTQFREGCLHPDDDRKMI